MIDPNVKADGRPLDHFRTYLDCPICNVPSGFSEPPDVFNVLTCPQCKSDYLVIAVYLTPRRTIALTVIGLSLGESAILRNAGDNRQV